MKNYKDVANSVFQRSDEIIADNRRRKKKMMSVALPIMCCILVAAVGFGANWKEFVTNDPTNLIEPTEIETPTEDPTPVVTEPITEEQPTEDPDIDNTQAGSDGEGAHGGEGFIDYERAYRWSLYTTSDLYDYIKENYDVGPDEEWLWTPNEREGWTEKYDISSPEYVPWTIYFVKKFDIPKDVFEKLNAESVAVYESMDMDPYDICYTQEEIDAIYSEDPNVTAEVLSTKYAIVSNGRALAPRFYLTASKDELDKYGVSQEQIDEKIKLLCEDKIIRIKDGEIMLRYYSESDFAAPLY